MKILFLKIFFGFWVVVTVVNVLSDLIVRDQLRRPPYTRAAMRSAMKLYVAHQAVPYEAGGCASVGSMRLQSGDAFYLADLTGKPLCGTLNATGLETLAQGVHGNKKVLSRRFSTFQVVASEVTSPAGKPYIAYLVSTYPNSVDFYSWLMPGWTTTASSGAVTIVFTILLVIPVRRLRKTAAEIAKGNLHARVPLGHGLWVKPRDEMLALMQDFNNMANRLEGLVQSRQHLLRDVSHELRSPLARMGVALEVARQQEGSLTVRPQLDRIDREAGRLNNLIGQLLSLSAMEHDANEASSMLLSELMHEVLPDVEYEATQHGCTIRALIQTEGVVRGDPDLLHSALENIVRNAIRYSPVGGEIEVQVASIRESSGWQGVVRVSDQGPGVPEEDLQAILLPFYRVDKSRRIGTGGFGVGLAIAERAVKLYGGRIEAHNRQLGGLVVEMILPLEQEAAVAVEAGQPVEEIVGQRTAAGLRD